MRQKKKKKKKKKKYLTGTYICFLDLPEEFPWESKPSSNHQGKQSIGVRVIDVLLYFHDDHRRVPNKADETQARLTFQRLTS